MLTCVANIPLLESASQKTSHVVKVQVRYCKKCLQYVSLYTDTSASQEYLTVYTDTERTQTTVCRQLLIKRPQTVMFLNQIIKNKC